MRLKKLILLAAIFSLPLITQAAGEFQISPAKVEVSLPAGGQTTRKLTLVNNTDKIIEFTVSVEDFDPGRDPETPVALLGAARGRYSLKDHLLIKPADQRFTLLSGEQRIVPVQISFATSTPAGGYYASVIFAAHNLSGQGQAQIVSRLGALFFARVDGTVQESGVVREFGLVGHNFGANSPFNFAILFENDGEIYLNPYGGIKVKNILGREVALMPIAPWFVLPHALRSKEITLAKTLPSGYYRATLELNRGYRDLVDTRTVAFWVISARALWLAFGLLVLIIIIGAKFLKALKFKP